MKTRVTAAPTARTTARVNAGVPRLSMESLEARALFAGDFGRSLVFIADNVANGDALAQSFPGAEVVRLDGSRSAIDQISTALSGRRGLDSVQLVTHGSSGSINLGSSGETIDARSLSTLAGTIRNWGQALSRDGDLVLWGCDIGSGKAGVNLVGRLAALSRADVAASNNLTGSTRFGADWNLEVKRGKVQSLAHFITPFEYAGTLAAPTISGATAGQAVNEDATIRPFNGTVVAHANPAATLSVSVTLDNAAKGVFTPASLASSGFVSAGGGVYTFSGTPAQVTTALARLAFDPTDNRVNTGSTETTTFTLQATEGSDTATNNTTTVVSTAVNDAPTVSGASSAQAVNDTATIAPFSSLTIGDADSPAQTLSITVALDNAAKGAFTSASLTASGFADAGGGLYTFSGTAAAATTAVRQLVFQPVANRVAVGSTETTTLHVFVNDGVAPEHCDATTTVVSTSVNNAPTISGASAGQTLNDTATAAVFSALTIADPDPTQQVAVTVTLDSAAKGVFTDASLSTSGFVHQGGGVYTFTGTAAQGTTAIRQLVFQPTQNRVAVGSTETTTFAVTANDAVAAVASDSTTTAISTSVNDAPTISGATAGQAVSDNATLQPFSGVTIADVDPGQSLSVSVALDTAAKGAFTSASLTASGFTDAGGGVYTFTGTAAAATTAIRALVFDPANNRVAVGSTETSTFTVSADDGVAAAATNNTTTVVSTSVNDAPTISGTASAQAVNDNSTLQPFSAVTISDPDVSASVLVAVTIDNTAKGTFTSASVTAAGFTNSGGGLFTFTGTPAAATAAIRQLVFQPVANRVAVGSTETTSLEIGVSDSMVSTSDTATTVVSTSINDAPTITGASAGQAVNDNATLQPFSGVTIGDVDPGQSLSVSVSLDAAAKGVFTSASLASSGFASMGGGVYTFTGTAAAATTAIRALVFDPTDNRVTPGSTETTTFTVSADDGVAAATTNSTTTAVSTSVNDAPTISGASAGQTVSDNATLSPFSGVTIGDVDNPAQTVSVSVTLDAAAKGVFTSASLTASGFTDAGGGQYTFSGTAAQATTAIRALVFNPTDNRVAVGSTETTTFAVVANDGVAADVSDSATTVVSTSVNDAPTITGASAGQAVNDNATLQPFSGVTIGDVDPSQSLTVTVTLDAAAKGVFTSASLTSSGFADVGGGVYSFTGSATAATTAIRALVFDPADNRVAPGSTETTTFTVSANDGVASAVSNNTTTVVSTSVNDTPTISGAVAGQATNDNANIQPFSAVTIGDVDNPAQTLTVTVSLDAAAKGVFTSASLSASGFSDAGGGQYTFTGTAAAATTAVRALVFDPTDNRVAIGSTETTTFTIDASDGTATGSNNTATVVSTSVNEAPTISGSAAGQAVNDNATVSPFVGVTIADTDANPTQSLTVSVTLDAAAKGAFTSASLTASGFADAGGGVYTFSGTAAQATTAIRALVFDPANNRVAVGSTETTTFAVSVNDGVAVPVSDSATTVVSTSVNDAPTIAGAVAGQAVNDNATISPFSGVTIADVDPGQTLSVSVALDTAAKGTFTSASLTSSGFASMGNGVFSFTGSAAAATTAIRALVFQPTANRVAVGSTETTTFTITASDAVAADVTNSTTTAVSTSINDAPTISGAAAGQAVNDNATTSPFSAVTIGDVDPSQSLSVTVTLDAAAKGVFTSASLTASGFVDAGGGQYTFTGTAAQATAAVRALVFNPADNRVAVGSTETTTFSIVANDGVAADVADSATTVVSTSVNDNPTVTGTVAGQAVNDNATLSPFSGVTLADVDPSQTLTVFVTIDNSSKGAFTSASLTASGFASAGDGIVSFTGTASAATTAIRALVFDPANNRVAPGSTETSTFVIAVGDGNGGTASDLATTVVSTSINDAPTISGTSAGQTVTDVTTVAPFSAVTIAEQDVGQSVSVTITLDAAAKGAFTSASLSASGFADAGSGVYTFSGTAAAATTAIRALVFNPADNRVTPGQTETTFFTVTVSDAVAADVTDSTTSVVSTSVNNDPIISGTVASQAVNDNATLQPFSGVTIADEDNPAQSISVSVTLDVAAKGVFTAASLTASGFVNAGGGVYTFTGTAAAATSAIRALVFDPTDNRVLPGQTETTTFAVSVNDGVAAAVSNSATSVVSTSVNDAPTISGTSAGQAVNDNATLFPFSAVTIGDADSAQTLTINVSLDAAAKGVFTAASLTASGFTNQGNGVYRFIGTASAATTAIRALSFDPTNNRVAVGSTETTTFTISASDAVAAAVTDNASSVVSTSINDVATFSGAVAGQQVNDNSLVNPFSTFLIVDADPGQGLTVTVTIDSAAKGVFTSASLTASGFASLGGGQYGFSGTTDQANAALAALVFDPTDNRGLIGTTETSTFTVTVNDGVASDQSNSTTTVASLSSNDLTVISGTVAAQAVNDNATIAPFTSVSFTDADNPSQDITVTVTFDVAAKGVFTASSLTTSGFVAGQNGSYTFTGSPAAATSAIRALVVDPTDNRVNPGQAETIRLTISTSDGFATVSDINTTVVSTSINDAPTLSGAVANQLVDDGVPIASLSTGEAFVNPFSTVTISDADGAQDLTVTVTLDDAAKGVFSPGSLLATGFVHQGNGVYTFTGNAQEATNAIRALVFDATDNRLLPGLTETTTFTIAVSDGIAPAVSDSTTTVVSESINDAPTIAGTSSGVAATESIVASPFANAVIFDFDANQQLVTTVTLDNAAKGAFTSASLTTSGFVNSGGGVYTFTGTAAQATAAVRALVFDPANNRVAIGAVETTTFTIRVNDAIANPAVNAQTTVVSQSINDAPSIGTVTTNPNPVNRRTSIVLTASGITDPDSTATTVEFYRDTNGNGTLELGIDTLLGSATVSNGTATRTVSTNTFAAGSNTFLARVKDNFNLFGVVATGTATINNLAPTAGTLSRSADPVVNLGDNLTLTLSSVADADGTINRVEFYRDADGNGLLDVNVDTLLGQDTLASGGYTLTFPTTGFSTGQNRYFARAIDNDGAASTTDTVTGRINAAPTATAVAPSLGTVTRGQSVVFSLTGAADGDGTISRVEFYRDANNNGTFDAGTDPMIGADTSATAGAYTFNAPTAAFRAGTNTVFARSKDNNGAFSTPVSTTITVNNVSPTAGSLSRSPAVVVNVGDILTLTANSIADADGTIARVQFFRDSDNNGSFDANVDALLGEDTSSSNGWRVTVPTFGFSTGQNRYFARAVDSDGAFSPVVTVTNTINAAPTIGSLSTSPATISRASTFTLSAGGVADTDGSISRVTFYRDSNNNGTYDASDAALGNGTLVGGVYRITLNGANFQIGSIVLFARALDNTGAFSTAFSGTFTVAA